MTQRYNNYNETTAAKAINEMDMVDTYHYLGGEAVMIRYNLVDMDDDSLYEFLDNIAGEISMDAARDVQDWVMFSRSRYDF